MNVCACVHVILKLSLQVMFAIGRDACTQGIGLEQLGVKMNPKYVNSIQ